MAYGLIGNDAIVRASSIGAGYTVIDLNVASSVRGILKEVYFYGSSAGVVKIKIFRDDGTNYVFIGEESVTATAVGANTLPIWLPVERGDLIGYYTAAVEIYYDAGISTAYLAGDITTTTAKASFSTNTWLFSFGGKVFTRVAPLVI